MRNCFILFNLLFFSQAFAQEFNNSWQFLGPDQKPLEDRPQGATGIGPVEHITAHPKVKDLLLASSINGGLFYSTDGGDQWYNSGSDDWMYSGCSWAQFHPTNEKVWFGNSCQFNANGGPGTIGNEGGIYRTMDSGLNWQLVANAKTFINSSYLTVYGMQFHPEIKDLLFIYTSEGIYFTENSLAEQITWERIPSIGGWVYDIAFTSEKMYFSQMQHGKWKLFEAELTNYKSVSETKFMNDLIDEKTSVTLETQGANLLVLVNYTRRGDELWKLKGENNEPEMLISNQRVIFGNGNTFAVSTHNPQKILLGYSTTIKKYQLPDSKEQRMGSGYHVDIEGALFDPFDSLKIYLATHGGVYVSMDEGASWVSKSKGIGIAEVEGLAVSKENPNLMAIGCFHDGSMLRADFNKDGIYQWKNINGGDGLVPIMPKNIQNVVYTSNQYIGGGLYMSVDTGKTNKNLHNINSVKTSGWRMAGILHPEQENTLFFNFEVPHGNGQGNIDVGRTTSPESSNSLERISDFKLSHGIEAYTIYGIYTSEYHPNVLFAHMIEETKNEEGKRVDVHRVWRTDISTDSAKTVIMSWYPVDIPRSDWIGSLTLDKKSANKMYLTYTSGIHGTELTDQDFGLIYQLKYKKATGDSKKEVPLTQNIPFSQAGRYNFAFDSEGGVYFGTRTGIYYGDKKTLKGKRDWVKVGQGLPHCKVRGMFYNELEKSLTVGFYGRGVWKYYLP